MFPRIERSPPGSLLSTRRQEADSLSIRCRSRAGVSKARIRKHSYGIDAGVGGKSGIPALGGMPSDRARTRFDRWSKSSASEADPEAVLN